MRGSPWYLVGIFVTVAVLLFVVLINTGVIRVA